MSAHSAGILLYRCRNEELEVFLIHPGGQFWAGRDAGVWSIPKGLLEDGEDPVDAARREFEEETGFCAEGPLLPLGSLKQSSGKIVYAWALAGDVDAATVRSNTFTLEWPPHSGRIREYPEVDRGDWARLARARGMMVQGKGEISPPPAGDRAARMIPTHTPWPLVPRRGCQK